MGPYIDWCWEISKLGDRDVCKFSLLSEYVIQIDSTEFPSATHHLTMPAC
jgi:hypothetical protein